MSGKWMLLYVAALAAAHAAESDPESDNHKLCSVIRAGDLGGLTALLEQGITPDVRDSREITPLMYAAEAGSTTEMRILIQHGADVNARNAFGSTALMWSIPDVQKVRLLLDHGADVNIAAKSGRTALLMALSRPSPETARLLLANGADTAAVDKAGVTTLLAALRGNDITIIRMLVENGADVNRSDLQPFISFTPLMAAAANGNLAAVKLLLAKGARVNAASPRHTVKVNNRPLVVGEFTPLLLAATYGPPEVVEALLDADANGNAAEARGMTPLMLAMSSDRFRPETVKILLQHGADPRVKSLEGETALDWAHKYGAASVIEVLGGKPAPRMAVVSGSAALPDPRVAVERSLALLERTSAEFFVQGGCFACHAQPAASFAAAAARAKGVRVDEDAARERQKQITFELVSAGPKLMEGAGGGDTALYAAEALSRNGYPPDRLTDYLAAEVAAGQREDGSWHGGGLARTPLEDGDFSRTAMAIRVLSAYGTPSRAAETKERIERGKQWLLHAEPLITEDWDMRLAGVATAGAAKAELRKLADPILALQRPDGGWAQRNELSSDAYATGMTLWALAEAGILQPEIDEGNNSVYRKGVRFLLSTQAPDGSWHVASRAAKLQPYFESGFPYGHDQWISSMGTGWATNALALTLKAPKN
jgi:ankyrin repeat protein